MRVKKKKKKKKNEFEYVEDERIFAKENLVKYSGKLSVIMEKVENSEGIILIYSQYIDGGCIPIALALEEMGFTRYGDKSSLFKSPPKEQLMIVGDESEEQFPAKYIMITGDSAVSGRNKKELKACTDPKNINGEIVKVVIISKAGSEGLDFKSIRQVHILEPWYNFNRTSQTIGRAIRNLSHCNLKYPKRNTQIFLYASELFNDGYIQNHEELESADLYIYRLAERKGVKIGKITKILKKNAVDCLLNRPQTQMSIENAYNKKVKQSLSNGKEIEITLGDKEYSVQCDFETCQFQCSSNGDGEIDQHTFNETFLNINYDVISTKIKELFKDQYLYTKSDLIKNIRISKKYNLDEINSALNYMIENNEYLVDKLNRIGKLKNIDNYYLFHPININETIALTNYKMRQPIPNKIVKNEILITKDDKLKQLDISEDFINDLKMQILYVLNLSDNITQKYNWTINTRKVINSLKKINYFNEDILKEFVVYHIIDILSYNEKKKILQIFLLYKNQSEETKISREDQFFYDNLDKYFQDNQIEYDGLLYYIIRNDDDVIYKFKLLKDDTEIKMTSNILKKIQEKYKLNIMNINELFGFLSKFKDSNRYVFKIKHIMNIKNNTGRKCGGNKTELIQIVNNLYSIYFNIIDKTVEQQRYFKSENSLKYNKMNNFNEENNIDRISKLDPLKLCIEIELLFRYLDYEYNNNSDEKKRFFFSTIEENIYDLKKIPLSVDTENIFFI